MTAGKTYVVAGSRPWNHPIFKDLLAPLPGEWHFVGGRDELTLDLLERLSPRYVFFLHWSWIMPRDIVEQFECVGFHMTDLPYGRGGSPLQNLILRGHRDTKLTAFRLVEEPDAGPVYLKEELSLEGGAEEIYVRACELAARMARVIAEREPPAQEQAGQPTVFERRKPAESRIEGQVTLRELYDFIRMLDAESYPHAFLEHDGFRYEFTGAALYDGRIEADVTITRKEGSTG
ncbi:MAG: methionyl-tRNA formyltransferase [Gemmatimonadetes bacterium]|nr:methionyl-tRNA formyltransferase [Gemmatimonadota bacterium]